MYTTLIVPYFKNGITKINNFKIKKILEHSIYDGKCIRGYITKYVMNTLSNNTRDTDIPIFIVELLQAISLVLDDLPCMDNALTRRKKKTSHLKFGEAETILTSIYIINHINKLLLEELCKLEDDISFYYDKQLIKSKTDILLKVTEICLQQFGQNIILGQLLDLDIDYFDLLKNNILYNTYDKNILTIILKTSSMFSVAFLLGAVFSQNTSLDLKDFVDMGLHLGILYQIVDDLIDYETDKDISFNYIREVGVKNYENIYLTHKIKLLYLLQKYKLNTVEFCTIIDLLDNKINTIKL
jgi:geranylgeranyl pyrophosphate synthase